MSTTTTTSSTSFPMGVIDKVLAELPFGVRFAIILNWARKFADRDYVRNPGIVEIIQTITTLDFRGCLMLNEATFPALKFLPFSHHLAHLDLSYTHVGKYQDCVNMLGHPIFQHLETLNLKHTWWKKETNPNPLFNAPHSFPNLHTLNFSCNSDLVIPPLTTMTKFPNLKVLDLGRIGMNNLVSPLPTSSSHTHNTAALQSQSSTTTSTSPQTTVSGDNDGFNSKPLGPGANSSPTISLPFLLEKLTLTKWKKDDLLHFSRLSQVAHLCELKLHHELECKTIEGLFDPEKSFFTNEKTNLSSLSIEILDPELSLPILPNPISPPISPLLNSSLMVMPDHMAHIQITTPQLNQRKPNKGQLNQ